MTTGQTANQILVSGTPPIPPSACSLSVARSVNTSVGQIKKGCVWPPSDLITRQRYQRFCMSLYDGLYAVNRKWIALVDNKEREIPFIMLQLNYFKRIADTVISLAFNNEVVVKADTPENTRQLQTIVDRTGFIDSIKQALLFAEIYGDTIIRVNSGGLNVLAPYNGMKDVNPHNVDEVDRVILFEYLFKDDDYSTSPFAVRFEVHEPGLLTEFVREYSGTTLGDRIAIYYRGRWISKYGNKYITDTNTAIWCSLNRGNAIYGKSSFDSIRDVVFAIESNMSLRNYIVKDNAQPFIVLGMQMFTTDEQTGAYTLKRINDKYLIRDDSGDPMYLEWGADNIESARKLGEDLMQNLYELSEISKSVMSGDYNGQVANETLQTSAKSAEDRAGRDVGYLWTMFQKALHALATLNGMKLNQEDVSLEFSVNRTLSDKEISEIAETLASNSILSRRSILKKYYGYTDDQCNQEELLISHESTPISGVE